MPFTVAQFFDVFRRYNEGGVIAVRAPRWLLVSERASP